MKQLFACAALVFCFFACETNTGKIANDEPSYTAARQCADSCLAFLPKMMLAYDSIRPHDEWEALKIKNNHDITQQNLEELEHLLDSMEQMAPGSPERANFKAVVSSQTKYLYSLLSSGKAILGNHSQSFGKWKDKPTAPPDSVLSPVK